jgi:alkylhydroperoxidase/carboxymuconolactone decarboxylase family protein YurZ
MRHIMTSEHKPTPVEYLAQYCPGAANAFQSLRKAVVETGPLDPHTCELIALGAFATARAEAPFKVHAARLLKEGVAVEALRHAVLVTFAATTTFSENVAALRWIDELNAKK